MARTELVKKVHSLRFRMLPPPPKGRPRGGYVTGFVVGFAVIRFLDTIDIIERFGIFAISECFADCVTRPVFCAREFLKKYFKNGLAAYKKPGTIFGCVRKMQKKYFPANAVHALPLQTLNDSKNPKKPDNPS